VKEKEFDRKMLHSDCPRIKAPDGITAKIAARREWGESIRLWPHYADGPPASWGGFVKVGEVWSNGKSYKVYKEDSP